MNETELERLVVRLQGDSTSYQKMVKDAQKSTQDLGDRLGDNTGRLAVMSQRVNAFGLQLRGYGLQMAAVGAGIVGVGGAMASVWQGVQLAAKAEATEMAFKSLVGNADEAKAALADLRKFAAETPFEQPEILAAAKQMLAFGTEAGDIVPTMQKLGDISSALEIPLGSLSYLFGTLKSQGRAFTVDINQFAMRGVPIWQELGKQFGMTNAEVRKLVEEGKVGFADVEKAFDSMTGPGGQFFDMMKEQSKTLTGLFSTMKDNVMMSLADVGKIIIEEFGLKELVQTVGEAAGQITEFIKSISPETKQFVTSLVAGGAAAAAIVAAIVAIKVGVAAVVGMFVALGPFGIAMVALFGTVSVGVAAVVNELGGVGATLEFLKTKATEAWEWLAPVRQAVANLAETITSLLGQAWDNVKQMAVEAWQSAFGDVIVNWEEVRRVAVRAVMLIEFGLLNLGRVSDLIWKKIQYDAVRVFNDVVHHYTVVVPAAFKYGNSKILTVFLELPAKLKQVAMDMASGFIQVNVDMFEGARKILREYIKSHVEAVRSIPRFVKEGVGSVFDFFKPGGDGDPFIVGKRIAEQFKGAAKVAEVEAEAVGKAAGEAMNKGFEAPQREEGGLEKSLREQYEEALGGMQQSFEEFARHRAVRDAFRGLFRPKGGDPAAEKGAPVPGVTNIGEEAKKSRKEVQLLDSVLVGSAAGRRRLEAHVKATATQALGVRRGGESGLANERANGLLAQISESTRNLAERTIALAEANF